jgi:hypothetical protein
MITQQVHDYALAIYYGADTHPLRVFGAAARVVRAKLKYRIGPFHFSLFDLAHVPEREWSEYIIMRPSFDARRDALSPGDVRGVVNDKIIFYEHCLRAGLPTIPMICCVGGSGGQIGSAVEHVTDPKRFEALLQAASPQIFVKPLNGAHGEDTFRATRHGGDFEYGDQVGNAADFFAYLQRRCGAQAGFILQPRIHPHPEMLSLASANGGLPTVRVVTAIYPDGPQVLFACLKIPVGANIADNFGRSTNGNLVAGIEVQSGAVTHVRGSSRRDWPVMISVEEHPDTGYRIAGSRVPLWETIIETALQGQRSLPGLKTIGWDIALTPEGVVLVEPNANYGVYSLQVANQRGLKSDLGARLGIVID